MSEELIVQLRRALSKGLTGIIFDCDGVLLNSKESNVRYYNCIREYFDMPPISKAEEHYVHMYTVMQSITHVLPPQYLERLGEATKGIDYMRDLVPYITPSDGISELLDSLKSAGVKLAVHTNRTTLADEVLSSFNLRDYFDPVVTATTHKAKPDPEGVLAILDMWNASPETVLFVGDSSLDERAAHAAGVKLVSYENPELDAEVFVNDFRELSVALQKCLE